MSFMHLQRLYIRIVEVYRQKFLQYTGEAFMRTFGIQSPEELRKIDHRAVMAWERLMREEQGSQASTVRRGYNPEKSASFFANY